jgi:hypothetical protein
MITIKSFRRITAVAVLNLNLFLNLNPAAKNHPPEHGIDFNVIVAALPHTRPGNLRPFNSLAEPGEKRAGR